MVGCSAGAYSRGGGCHSGEQPPKLALLLTSTSIPSPPPTHCLSCLSATAAQVYEHPQNVLLVRLINGNLDLLAVHREETTAGAAGAAGATSAEATAQAQLGKSLRLWLDLQNSLNALIDSNAGEPE